MGKLDIDYQVLHDAFFKYQTKPNLSGLGELYYEGKEFEARVSQIMSFSVKIVTKATTHRCVWSLQHCRQHISSVFQFPLCWIQCWSMGASAQLLARVSEPSSCLRIAGEERQGGAGHAAAAGGAGHGGGRPAAVAHQHAALRAAALLPRPAGERAPVKHAILRYATKRIVPADQPAHAMLDCRAI